ncbi:MAG: hypothetical protein WAN51_09880 [Alphaproteobacteria bacterium]
MPFLSKLRPANLIAPSFAVVSAAFILASCVPPPKPSVTGVTADSTHAADIGHPVPVVQNSETQPSTSTSTESQSTAGASAAPGGADANAAASENEQTTSLGHKPNELVGLSADQVTNLLGKPSFVRHDMPAEVWQYRARDCVLDVFLYPPVKSGGDKEHTVLYYELRGKNAQKISGEGCYGALISANHSS